MPIAAAARRSPLTRSLPLLAVALAACGDAGTEPRPTLRPETYLPTQLASEVLVGIVPAGWELGPRFNGHFFEAPPILPGVLAACPYSADDGRRVCPAVSVGTLVVTRSFALADAAGAPQASFDATTDRVNVRSRLAGTTTLQRGGDVERGPLRTIVVTVDRRSDETVSGFASPDGRLRHDGVTQGTETELVVLASAPRDTLRVERQFADTVEGLVVPGYAGRGPSGPWANLPASGRAVRTIRLVTTRPGEAPRVSDVRLVSEYLEGYVIRTTVTIDGTVRTCEQPFDRFGMPYCG